MLVRGRMTREVVTASPSATLAEASALARRRGIRHLPVVDEGTLVGMVTERDLLRAVPAAGTVPEEERRRILGTRTVREVMARQVVTVTPDTPVEEAALLLADHDVDCLPVVEDGRLVGILSETDLLRAFAELFRGGGPTSRIEVRMPNRPGELARVVRAIGVEHRVNITGMVVPPLGPEESVAIIHLQTPDAAPVVESLRKMGYIVN